MKTGQRIRRVRYIAPAPYGVEVMTLAQLRELAPPGYLQTPQRPAFHLLILGTSGRATHTVDFREYPVGRGRGVWVRPGQVQRFSHNSTASGDLVLFQPDFLIPGTEAAAIADDRSGPVPYDPPKATRDRLDQARRALREEYAGVLQATRASDARQTETLRHLLSILILRLAAAPIDPVSKHGAEGLHGRFGDLLERDFAVAHDVDHYASALGYSARTLSRATQAAGGETPKQMIQERIVLEASRLLATPISRSPRSPPTSAFAIRRTSRPSSPGRRGSRRRSSAGSNGTWQRKPDLLRVGEGERGSLRRREIPRCGHRP